jgi:tRNA pseudouridine55 synthase
LKTADEYLEGQILLIDKPCTSFQAVNKLKYALINKVGLPKKFKIGHRNVRSIGNRIIISMHRKIYQKKLQSFKVKPKVYGTFYIGATTPSYDLETEIDQTFRCTYHRSLNS